MNIIITIIAFIPLVLSIIALILSITYAYKTISSRKKEEYFIYYSPSNALERAALKAALLSFYDEKGLIKVKRRRLWGKKVTLSRSEKQRSSLFSKEYN